VVTGKVTKEMPFRCYSLSWLGKIPTLALIIGNGLVDYYAYKKMIQIFKAERPNIIHLQDFFLLIPTLKAAKKLKIPVVMTIRSTTFACNLSNCLNGNKITLEYSWWQYGKWLYDSAKESYHCGGLAPLLFLWFYHRNNLLRKWFKRVNFYVGVSDFIRREAIKVGLDESKTSTIKVHKGEWSLRKEDRADEFRVFSAGTLSWFKGFDYLIRAFRKVADKYPQAMLRIAGDGAEKVKLIALIKELNLEKNVILLGKINYEQMHEEYVKASFAVTGSIGPECLSRTIFESFSLQRTIISTDVGGNSELVIDEKTGLLVQPKDEEKVAVAILRLLEDKKLREKLALAGRKLVEKEANESGVVKRHLEVYQKVLELNKKPAK